MDFQLDKKAFYPVTDALAEYLSAHRRSSEIPGIYRDLLAFQEKCPLFDKDGNDTLWKTVLYEPANMRQLSKRLGQIYSELKTGDTRVSDHLFVERVDYCQFGNSKPFRIRIVNQFNDNYDHFYVKVADASRIFGLELEHILSPNRINYIAHGETLIEEHIPGVPGDVFIRDYLTAEDLNQVRLAKEFVKFSERSFIRLLGDMRSYNYVVDITPDFEEVQYRVRAIDFDQQSYEGHKGMYWSQSFPDNDAVVKLCTSLLNYPTIQQYQDEERNLVERRLGVERDRLERLLAAMALTPCSTAEKTEQLAQELGEFHHSKKFKECRNMAEIVRVNIEVELAKAKRDQN